MWCYHGNGDHHRYVKKVAEGWGWGGVGIETESWAVEFHCEGVDARSILRYAARSRAPVHYSTAINIG